MNDLGSNPAAAQSALSAKPQATAASHQQEWPPLLELAAQEVFDIMLDGPLGQAMPSQAEAGENFTAMVGLAGSLRGVVTFFCGAQPAHQIAARMLRLDAACSEEQVCDAIGEICNMIAGNFKNKLTGLDKPCLLSVPAVVTGRAYRFHSLAGGESLEVMLTLAGWPLIVRLDIHA
ncbi:MAG: chemotaxis protein CheX [Acidobacteria bacterium]|nr:chemotaxis protein CheX [Acidobacteriota bacterium]